MLLDQIDALTAQIDTLTTRIERTDRRASPPPSGADADGTTGPTPATRPGRTPCCPRSTGSTRSPASGRTAPQVIIAEIGLDMSRFPTAGHLVSWAKLSPAHHPVRDHAAGRGQTGKGNPYLKGVARRGRRRGRQDRHLPRRTLPAHRQTPRQAQGPGRRRPLHPGHHLAPARRPHRPLPRPRRRLPHPPHRHEAASPQPHPPTRSPRLPPSPSPPPPEHTPHRQPVTADGSPQRPPTSARHRQSFSDQRGARYRCAARFPHPPFNPYVRFSRIRLTDDLLDRVTLPSGSGWCRATGAGRAR